MAEVLLFHHAQGLTPGVAQFADELRGAGHVVHTPDLFDGRTFDSIDEGMAYIESVGFEQLSDQAMRLADDLPEALVYAGFSFGVVPAQKLAQTRPGARAAILMYSCLPLEYVGPWPTGLPAQIHGMESDPVFAGEGDLDAAREIAEQNERVEVFLYPGDQHYFADSSLPSYDAEATAILRTRVLDLLGTV